MHVPYNWAEPGENTRSARSGRYDRNDTTGGRPTCADTIVGKQFRISQEPRKNGADTAEQVHRQIAGNEPQVMGDWWCGMLYVWSLVRHVW